MTKRQFTNKEIEFYKIQRQFHTLEKQQYLFNKYCKFDKLCNIWEIIEDLNNFHDVSDPDLSLPNSIHNFQVAEQMRIDNKPNWLILTGLLHDVGKILSKWGNNIDGTSDKTQWSVVGDTYLLGCELPNTLVCSEYNNLSIYNNSTKLGIYKPNCGLTNCKQIFGHDEYMYQFLNYNDNKLPIEASYIIHFHSMYVYHTEGEYKYLMDDFDHKYLPYVKEFNKYDLYTKENKTIEIDMEYYKKLILKYFNSEVLVF